MDVQTADEQTSREAPGKRQLMAAALRLSSTSRSLSSIGLRELAREAGLNPNTFYRHFRDVDDLGMALIEDISTQLRQPLRELRREAAARAACCDLEKQPMLFGIDMQRGRRVTHETVQLFFDFVDQHPTAFLIGVRELHGASPRLRQALISVMDEFAEDMTEDIGNFKLLPANLDATQVRQISYMVSHNLFGQVLDYLAQPARQTSIRALAEEKILMLFAGAAVLQSLGQLQLPAG
ncbi:MAG: TetR family transcriptional regulator [Pseudomonas sp.]|uniref:TetR family transcriptional regulator n=1 Tax=Pseudomonas sp. TaxID=306 RepID=UPI0027327F5D|nr:TetR family transcriptional regulator [Pseudomonas sp.]MDP3845054.1 TetR family transcriptional regulator [Pseudomonas sp.]